MVWQLLISPVFAGSVTLSGATWATLQPQVEGPQALPPAPIVAEREVRLTPDEEGVQIAARWWIEAPRPGWVSLPLGALPLQIERLSWRGEQALPSQANGQRLWVAWVERSGTLELLGRVDGRIEGGVPLDLLPASKGWVESPGMSLRAADGAAVVGLEDRYLAAGARLVVGLERPAPSGRGQVVQGRVGMGLTVGEGEVTGRAHLSWAVLSGSLSRVSFSASGLGADLALEGQGVRTWRRAGDRVEVELQGEVRDGVHLDLSWTQQVAQGAESHLQLPVLSLDGVGRTERSLQLARDGELEVVPALQGFEGIAASSLPSWGQGLVEGTPTAAWRGASQHPGGSLDLLRYVPVPGPPVVVDVAQVEVALSEGGAALLSARYEVRNERAAHLSITPPPGMTVISALVDGETTTPVRGEEGAWLLPLVRSLETVDGLLSFPVEVVMLGQEGDPWGQRAARALPLPVVDAEVAVSRATVWLPAGWRSTLAVGEAETVLDFTEGDGITYGFAAGEVDTAAVDARFRDAVEAWKENDFSAAQSALDDITALGASNDNIARLQSNIDVVEGRSDGGGLAERRVKDQARARAAETERQLESNKRKARERLDAGDYEEAQVYYNEAIELSRGLVKLEQAESVDRSQELHEMEESLAVVEQQASADKKGSGRSGGRGTHASVSKSYVFEAQSIGGSLSGSDDGSDADWVVTLLPGEYAVGGGSYAVAPPRGAAGQVVVDAGDGDFFASGGDVSGNSGGSAGMGALFGAVGDAPQGTPGLSMRLEGLSAGGGYGAGGGGASYGAGGSSYGGSSYGAGGSSSGGEGTCAVDDFEEDYDVADDIEAPPPMVSPQEPARWPDRVERASEERSSGPVSGVSLALPRIRHPKRPAAGPPEPKPSSTLDIGIALSDDTSAPRVIATSAQVEVPRAGEALHYQHLLVPPGEVLDLQIEARGPRRRR